MWTRAGTPAGRGSTPCFTAYVQHGNSRMISAYNVQPRKAGAARAGMGNGPSSAGVRIGPDLTIRGKTATMGKR